MRHTAVYVRVSTRAQGIEAQLPDLLAWCERNYLATPPPEWFAELEDGHLEPWTSGGEAAGHTVWYADKFTGRTMRRPGMDALVTAIRARKVERLVVWRLDRLGRTAHGLLLLFSDCREYKTELLSLRDGFDLTTPSGTLLAQILASVAEFELELRKERVAGGIQANRDLQIRAHRMAGEGKSLERIALELRQSVADVERMLAKPPGTLWYGGRSKGTGMVATCTKDRVRELLGKGLAVDEVARATGASRRTVFRRLQAIRRQQ